MVTRLLRAMGEEILLDEDREELVEPELVRFSLLLLYSSKPCFCGLVRVGVKIAQDGNRANTYKHVAVVHEHVCGTLCSVCATGARVAQPVPCNS